MIIDKTLITFVLLFITLDFYKIILKYVYLGQF